MADIKFADAVVEGLVCPADRQDAMFTDSDLKGFCLRVSKSGSKQFILQYRGAGGKIRRVPLGTWGVELTAAKARKKAEVLRGQVRDQRDPVAERAAARAVAAAEEAAARLAEAEAKFTVEALIKQWADLCLIER
ncbi:MAG TPA: Arm DNA-binding domain-containing protein, partial [Rhodopila sp.]|nr:Arm DNA-binding domain-containing protein [Rhodopila sp.]